MPYKDKNKAKEYKRKWNKQYYQKNRNEEQIRTGKRKIEMRQWFREYKKVLSCQKCGENYINCLEFHHMDSKNKDFGISDSIWRMGYSRNKILSEIEKCTVLCANCHRKQHSGEIPGNSGSNPLGAIILKLLIVESSWLVYLFL